MRSRGVWVLIPLILIVVPLSGVRAAELTPVSLTLQGEIPFISAAAAAYGGPDLDLGSTHILQLMLGWCDRR